MYRPPENIPGIKVQCSKLTPADYYNHLDALKVQRIKARLNLPASKTLLYVGDLVIGKMALLL